MSDQGPSLEGKSESSKVEYWQLSEFGREAVKKRKQKKVFDLVFWNSLLHKKVNDNHANFMREEILRIEKEYNLISKEPLFSFNLERPNFFNMKPESMKNYHWFAKFELSVLTNKKIYDQDLLKKKLKVVRKPKGM